ncbi:uncharacterized protein LOC117008512 isoform X2 [Catharus ustulatus]|uniref:uncharacterized protein LOC117008512 isoform X2 n=1 Tax=Catharus ustulatus TaxID=91951 RepID=UPI00140C7A9F|nr:uncharacterized protein LOC117008512 isoform X2 [Catharus ustulatus]
MEIIKAKKEVVLMRTVLRVYQHKLAQKETCESFPDDSSEDPVEGSESSIKPKIPLSDPVVVPNFFLPPQEMEASMRLLSTSSHPSASPEGCRSALEPGRKTRQEPAGEECRCQAALSGARGLEQRWLQGVRSTGSRSCASPSATMVGLKPPEVPPTITMKFISAGMAGCIADLCTFPLDTAKVRLQIQGEVRIPRTISSVEYRGVLGTLSTMVRTEGARSLYRGLAAGLQRQMGFSSISIGLYDPVKQLYTPKGAERPGVPTPALSRHRRGHTDPGWLHHGGCGRGLCAAHRRGQGAVPGQRGPVGQRAPLQQHCGRLPHHRQGGGDPRALERNAAQHRPQRHHQLRGARHLRHHQGRAAAGTAHGRQRPVPLRGRLWRRVLCHSGGIAGGRGEDAVHELQPRAVQQRPELPPGPAHAGWPRRPLQGLCPVLPAAGLLERGDVCVIRAAAACHGAGTAGPGLSPSAPLARPARLSINHVNSSIILIAKAPGSSGAKHSGGDRRDRRRIDVV